MSVAMRRWTVVFSAIGVAVCWGMCVKAATESAPADRKPRTPDGALIVFPDEVTPDPAPDEGVVRVENVFSDERVTFSMNKARELYEAHERLQNAFYQNSNLGEFDTGTNRNPYSFQTKEEIAKLPDDAVIEWTLSKEELVDLDLPAWDMLVLGGANHHAFLDAWQQYVRYNTARLDLRLMDCEKSGDPERRAALEKQLAEAKQAVITYLQTPPAD